MREHSTSKAVTGISIAAAMAASLCCITPLLALFAGASGAASSFSWLEPVRPFLIVLSIVTLGFAWYRSFSKKENAACGPDGTCTVEKKGFFVSTTFLPVVTIAAIALMAFPYYANIFYPSAEKQSLVVVESTNIQAAKFTIKGMTCAGCEEHVNNELSKVSGVIDYKTSYAEKSSLVTFNKTKVDVKTILASIKKTGYTVSGFTSINEKK